MEQLFGKSFSEAQLAQIGITAYGVIDTKKIVFSEEARHLCAKNRCRNYGKTWAFPHRYGDCSVTYFGMVRFG